MHFSALRVLLALKISIIYKIKNYIGDHILYNLCTKQLQLFKINFQLYKRPKSSKH